MQITPPGSGRFRAHAGEIPTKVRFEGLVLACLHPIEKHALILVSSMACRGAFSFAVMVGVIFLTSFHVTFLILRQRQRHRCGVKRTPRGWRSAGSLEPVAFQDPEGPCSPWRLLRA